MIGNTSPWKKCQGRWRPLWGNTTWLWHSLCDIILPSLSTLKHDSLIHFYDRIRTFHPQTRLDVVIRSPLVHFQLFPAVFQAIHPHLLIKSRFICPVLAFYFPVMSRRCYLYPVIHDPSSSRAFSNRVRCLLLITSRRLVNSVPLSVCTSLTGNGAWRIRFFQKISGTIGAMFIIQLSVCPSAAFIHCSILIIFSPVCYAIRRHIFHINLYFCPG